MFLSALFVPKEILIKGLQVADGPVSLSWESVLRLSLSQNTHAIMYSNLRKIQGDMDERIPEIFMKKLRELYYKAAARDAVLYNEFGKICDALNGAGVEFMPIKGAVIAYSIYPESHLRPFKDIDILLNTSELPRIVEKELAELGYELHNPGFKTSPFFLKKTSAGPISIELHGQGYAWNRLHRSHQLDYSLIGRDLWQRSKIKHIQSVKVKTMSPEDLLLITCLNRADLADLRLMDVNDVMGVLTQHADAFDWNYVERKLSMTGAVIVFHLLQSFIKSVYGLDVVPRAFQTTLEKDVRNRLFGHMFGKASILQNAQDFQLLYLVYRAIFLDNYDIRHQFINTGHLKNLLQARIVGRRRDV